MEEAIKSKNNEEDGENEVLQLLQGIIVEDPNDIRVAYHNSTWFKLHSLYDSKPILFIEENFGLKTMRVYQDILCYFG